MNTRQRPRAVTLALLALAVAMAAAPALAANKPAKEAEEQVNRGYRAAKRGYWQEALFRFERANELTPNDPRILNNIAVSLEASGRFEEARVAYEAALAVAPGNRVLTQNYSRFKEFYESQVEPSKPAEERPAEPEGSPAGEESGDA